MQSPSAVCAVHPQLGAVFTCERCGSFGCDDCRGPYPSILCLACFQRLAPVSGFTSGRLLRDSFSLMRRNLSGVGLFLGIHLLGMLPFFLLSTGPEERWWLGFLLFFGGVALASAAFFTWTAAGLLQSSRSLASTLRWALRRSPFLVVQGGLVLFSLWLLAAIFRQLLGALPPGSELIGIPLFILSILYLASCWFLAPVLIVLEGRGPLEALRRSVTLTQGHRGTLMVVFALRVLLLAMVWVADHDVLPLPPQWDESTRMALSGVLELLDYLALPFFGGMMVLAWMHLAGRVPPEARHA